MDCTCKKKDCYYCWLKGRIYTIAAQEEIKPMTLCDVLEKVSATSGVPVEQITGRSRKEKARIARQVFCYIARKTERSPGVPRWTLDQIGRMVNYRRHTAVCHSVKLVEAMLNYSNEPKYTALCCGIGVQYASTRNDSNYC